jgi:signal transduction histidine kinase/DNA-binding response OmpR family regulator
MSIKNCFIPALLLFICANTLCAQDTTAGFWTAVTPKTKPYDKRKTEEAFAALKAFPMPTVYKQPTKDCPEQEIVASIRANVGNTGAWLKRAEQYRQLGYIDCSNHTLETLIRVIPDADMKQKLDAYVELGFNYLANLQVAKADSLAKAALAISEKQPQKHAGVLYIAAYAAHRNRRTEYARDLIKEALNLAEKTGEQRLQVRILSVMGVINRDVFFGHSLKAIPFHTKALEMAESQQDTTWIISELMMLSVNYQDARDFDLHYRYMMEAMGYLKYFESTPTRMRVMNILATNLDMEGRLKDALELRLENIKLAEACHSMIVADMNLRLSGQYLDLKQYEQSKAALDKAFEQYKQAGMDSPDLLGIYEQYYTLAKAMGNTGEALRNLEKAYSGVSDNYYKRNAELLSRMETEYRTGEKEKMLQTMRRQGSLIIIGSLILALLAFFVLIGYFRQRKTSRLLSETNVVITSQAEELKSLEKLKSRFFANVSHELRTPLSLILGPINSLLKQENWQGKDLHLLQLIQRNSNQLLKLVNEILDLSKLETGKLEVREKPVNWLESLRPTLAQFSSFGGAESVSVTFQSKADPALWIYSDTDKAEKILHNFLSNALKFTPKGGTVSIIAEDLGDKLQLSVRDAGPGIHPNDMPHIFDRFYQSKLPDAPTQGGTGIGLSLCRELAELLGGSVWAESIYGEGSTFYFRFPKKVALVDVVDKQETETIVETEIEAFVSPELPTGANRPLVLIVEDNPELRGYLSIVLDGYETITAENGKVALDMLNDMLEQRAPLSSRLPDLIISDLMMPVMDGFGLLEWVKSKDALRHIPYIMLTARADVKVKLRALRIGVDDYMLKPFVEEELVTRVKNLLAHYYERVKNSMIPVLDGIENEEIPGASAPVLSESNVNWLKDVEQAFIQHISDPQFNMDRVAASLNLSERQFRRRLQQLTGLSPSRYLKEIRFQTAKDLLLQGKYRTVKEVSFAVGISDTKYFSQLFSEHFGAPPSHYLR